MTDKKHLNVLSLFDGMSGMNIALKTLGITPNKYYASEIDKYAIAQTQLNFPNTIQLGSVTEWRDWDIDWKSVDLIGSGSPCQGFSFAGKQLAFDDPRSKLFFVFIEILNHIKKLNPDVKFLLENVDMKKEHRRVINEMTGVVGQNINSNLVSAQNRSRWYWSDIRTKLDGFFSEVQTDIPQPKDQGILLRDILESEVEEKYYLSDGILKWWNKNSEFQLKKKYSSLDAEKGICLTARSYESWNGNYVQKLGNDRIGGVSFNERGIRFHRGDEKKTGISELGTIVYDDQKSQAQTTQHPQLIMTKNYAQWDTNGLGHNSQNDRAFFEDTKAGTLGIGHSMSQPKVMTKANTLTPDAYLARGERDRDENGRAILTSMCSRRIRRLTPTECARLQTIPDWYIWQCSNTQQYRMLGNGWTNAVITHILSFLWLH